MRQSITKSPFPNNDKSRSKERKKSLSPSKINVSEKDMIKACENNVKNIQLHKSVAETLFKGYNEP